MISRVFTSFLVVVMVAGLASSASPQANAQSILALPSEGGEKRVALVIGNSKYRTSPLRNPANDAMAIAKALKTVGFDVILKLDATRREMRRSMIQFGRRLKDGGVGLFYYAGHGVQLYGDNYLIPVGAEIEAEDHVEVEAIELNQVLARMGGARNRLNIVILDACRNNPFARMFRSSTRGLAQTLAPAGTYIAYATAPGDVAEDGVGRNSLYTQALMRWMRQPGLKLEDVFKRVRGRVYSETDGKQVPWTSSSITGDFYFLPKRAKRIAKPTRPASGPDQRTLDLTFWNSVKTSDNTAEYEDYLTRFPRGIFSNLARTRIAALKKGSTSPDRATSSTEPSVRKDEKKVSASPKKSAKSPGPPQRPTTKRPTPSDSAKSQLAAVDPKAKAAPSAKTNFSGIWVGEDKHWKITFVVRGAKIEGSAECPYRERSGSTGATRFSTSGDQRGDKTNVKIRGVIRPDGSVDAATVDAPIYRRLVGKLPKLRFWDGRECGGANFVLRREGDRHAKQVQRVASADPNTRASQGRPSGTWVGKDQLWEITLRVVGREVEGRVVCTTGEIVGTSTSSQFSSRSHGPAQSRVKGTVDPEGRINAETLDNTVNYRKLAGTLPNLVLWNNGQCRGANFVMRRNRNERKPDQPKNPSLGTGPENCIGGYARDCGG